VTAASANGGFDALAGAGTGARSSPPPGIRTMSAPGDGATRIVLIRHGEAVCNVSGVCGGPIGCGGLTRLGRHQVEALRDRLLKTGELAGADVLYASVLPRAIETATIVAPALAGDPGGGGGPDGPGAGEGARAGSPRPPAVVTECDLCELHPCDADGLTWDEFTVKYGTLNWDIHPEQAIAPGGESWTGFVGRVGAMLDTLAARHPGQLVVVACHAGVVEASLLTKVPVSGGREGARLKLRTKHASMTTWEIDSGQWRLLGFNDAAHQVAQQA
jgi:broad specificity phosphatase PhoE